MHEAQGAAVFPSSVVPPGWDCGKLKVFFWIPWLAIASHHRWVSDGG
jgi:hypothetical protein